MSREVAWRPGRSRSVPAATVAAVLDEIAEQHGEVDAHQVVEVASDPDHVMHGLFEWDDSRAGHLYRVQQARTVINSIVIVRDEMPKEPAFVAVRVVDDEGVANGYRPTELAMRDPQTREQVLSDVLRQIEGLTNRHDQLAELDPIRCAIAKTKELQEQAARAA